MQQILNQNFYHIVLDRAADAYATTVYYQAGQAVTGRLKVRVNRPNFVKIDVSVTGQCGSTIINNWVPFFTSFFNDTVTVWCAGEREGGTNIPLSPGTYNFPFHLALPQNIPSSYRGQHGKIEYNIQVIFSSGPCSMCLLGDKFTLVVQDPIIFDSTALSPRQYIRETVVRNTGCTCISGPVTVLLELPKSAFRIGESITFTANITNNGPTGVKMVSAQLISRDNRGYRSGSPRVAEVYLSSHN